MGRMLNTVAGVVGLLIILLGLMANVGVAQAADPQPDPETVYEEARTAINQAEYKKAARLFAVTRALTEERELAAQTLYWEAFARYRLKTTPELNLAAALLARLQEEQFHLQEGEMEQAELELAEQADALAARVDGELAQRGEAEATRRTRVRVRQSGGHMDARAAALQALIQLDPERAQPALEKIIQDDSPENMELRSFAVMMACHENGPKIQNMLVGMLETETDPEFLSTIIMCLSENSSPEILDKLMALYEQTDDPEVAQTVIISMVRQDGTESRAKVFDFLAGIAQDKTADPDNRANALMALSSTGSDDQVMELLKDLLKTEKDPEILEFVLMSLSRVDSEAANDVLLDLISQPGVDEEIKSHALFAASMHGRSSIEFLEEVYASAETADLKLQVCHLLSRHHDKKAAFDAMLEIAENEPDGELKTQMVMWIGQFEDPRAADFLLDILNSN
jgi:HEAT repeats